MSWCWWTCPDCKEKWWLRYNEVMDDKATCFYCETRKFEAEKHKDLGDLD